MALNRTVPGFEWAAEDGAELGYLDSDFDSGVKTLYGRQFDGQWEYVCLRWFHHSPHLCWTLKGGVFESHD